MNPQVAFETITPALAKKLLDKNTSNRPMNEENLASIVMEMKRDNFHTTGESIKIAQDGTLIDGQHRLMAIVKTGQPIKLLVVRGLENDAFKYVDTGRTRKASDVLAIEGIKNPGKIASITKFIIAFWRGSYFGAAGAKSKRLRLTNADVSGFVDKNYASLEDSFHYGFNKHNKLVSGTMLASMHFYFKKINDAQADDFCHKVAVGIDVQNDNPIYLFRQMMLQDIRSQKKMAPVHKLALLCKAWNFYRQNAKIKILKWDSTKEAFPKPI